MDNTVRDKILNIANKVIAEKGLNHFTLEEVAREAGISKGGLLYHYPSKDLLIKGLIEYHIEQFQKRILQRQETQTGNPNSDWFISFVREKFTQTGLNTNTMTALLAAVAMNQDLLYPVKENSREWMDRINKLKDPIMGIIISLACDGIAFSNLFGLEVISSDIKGQVMDRLIKLIEECS